MSQKPDQPSGGNGVQVFELTMDNPEDQDELNRRLRKADEPNSGTAPKNGHADQAEEHVPPDVDAAVRAAVARDYPASEIGAIRSCAASPAERVVRVYLPVPRNAVNCGRTVGI
jgi:hypothetical protein